MTKTFSLRNILIIMFCVLLIIMLGLLFFASSFISNTLYEQSADINAQLLQTQLNSLDEKIDNANQYLYRFMTNDRDVSLLGTKASADDTYFAEQNVRGELSDILLYNRLLGGICFYSPDGLKSELITETSYSITLKEKENIEEYVKTAQTDPKAFSLKWRVINIEGKSYFLRIMKNKQSYCCLWINSSAIYEYLEKTLFTHNGTCVLSDSQGKVVPNGGNITQVYMLGVPSVKTVDYGSERFYQLDVASATGDFSIVLFTSEYEVTKGLWVIRDIIIGIFVLFILLVPIIVLIQKYFIYNPTRQLVQDMSVVRKGNIHHRVTTRAPIREFASINHMFNLMMDDLENMVEEINDLRLNIYEQQLHEKETKLQFLQVSIKGHFILNCLNTIYYLSEMQKFELIQQFTLYLTAFFRYMSNDSMSIMPLAHELEYVDSYMNIQKMCFPGRLTYIRNVNEELLGLRIPPLVLHTFIENCIKYSVTMDSSTTIQIDIDKRQINGKDYMQIIVRDDGPGIDPHTLERLNSREADDESEHMGTRNIADRLEAIYKNEASIRYENDNGTVVTTLIPLKHDFEDMDEDGYV